MKQMRRYFTAKAGKYFDCHAGKRQRSILGAHDTSAHMTQWR
jgi:hypothetical protein